MRSQKLVEVYGKTKKDAKRQAAEEALEILMETEQVGLEGRKDGNDLFNDALNTFYFTVIWHQTYGKGTFR